MLKSTLEQLLVGRDLSCEEISQVILGILDSKIPQEQAAAFLTLLKAKGESPEELLGLIEVLQRKMHRIEANRRLLDIVGTGGDGAHTVNISTGAAMVAATLGVPVAKHGNRSVSSLCGSIDVVEALKLPVALSEEEAILHLTERHIAFLYAPAFHPALAALSSLRKNLGLRTILNLAGPLLNPAEAAVQMIGVCKAELISHFAFVASKQKRERVLIFHSAGLDELTPLAPAQGILIENGKQQPFFLDPQHYGIKRCALHELQGGDANCNATKLLACFSGEKSALSQTLALNAGVALYLYGSVTSISEGIDQAQKALLSGAVLSLLQFKEAS